MRKSVFKLISVSALTAAVVTSAPVFARDNIQVVGSSTVYPFVTVVAEKFGRSTDFNTPIIESTGSGGGMKLFCTGVGGAHPDFTNASRRIKKSEFDICQENGVTNILEIKIGYDGIVLANSKKADRADVSRKDIFLALAKEIPNPDGSESLVENTYQYWNEVNPSLPAIKIEVLGPPPTSGTRDAFVELAMEGGCKSFNWIKAMKKTDKGAYKALCHTIREDGGFVEAGENDNLIVQKLDKNPDAFGIFGYSFLDQNSDKVQGSLVDGIEPEFENISDGSYPVSRSLYVYGKVAHIQVTPGMSEFIAELVDEDTLGEEGYLADRGLISMPEEEMEVFQENAENRTSLEL
ncbi:MAG: phosphate ABC transporter substrate-binding protein [Gammaproteobacteria bacterium]|nr:phosphate ABC transporter substrate-binding protein [Gammaproteobacteria bacterium]